MCIHSVPAKKAMELVTNEILEFCTASELRSNKQISQAPCERVTRGVLTLGFFSSKVTITVMPEH